MVHLRLRKSQGPPRRCAAALLTLAFTLTATTVLAQEEDFNALTVSSALGGRDIYEALRDAKKVTAQRVDTVRDEMRPDEAKEGPELYVLGEATTLDAEKTEQLKKIFMAGGTYLSSSKACRFRANIRFVFTPPAGDPVDLVLCFGCAEIEIWRKSALVSFTPFDPAYAELLTLVRGVFPNDEFMKQFKPDAFVDRVKAYQDAKPSSSPAP